MRLLFSQFTLGVPRFVFQEVSPEGRFTPSTRAELDTLQGRVAQAGAPAIEPHPFRGTSSEATSEKMEVDLESVFDLYPEKSVAEIANIEGEPFRKALIEAMFGSDKVQFTLDDDPFCNRNAIDRFCTPMLDWLDVLGCSIAEKQKYTAQMVRFYVIGDRMLIPVKPGGTDQYYDFRELHVDRDPSKPIRDIRIDKTIEGKIPEGKSNIIQRLVGRGLSPDCFQFHEVVGHPKPSRPTHLMNISAAEFNAKMESFRRIIQTVTGDESYEIGYVRTTGGGGMGGAGFKDASLKQYAEKWKLAPEYWTAETDTGRKGGHMNGTQMRDYYLERMKGNQSFIPLMHFQRQHLDTFDTSFYDGLARGFVDQKFDVELPETKFVDAAVEPVLKPATEYVVQPGDRGLSVIGSRFGVSWKRIAEFNNIEAPYIIKPGDKLEIPSSKKD